jgi:hypothetical protein
MPQPFLSNSYEDNGFDGERNGSQWWFEAWGSGSKESWRRREETGRPPTPSELNHAEYIVLGIRHPSGEVMYRTRVGGLDLDPSLNRR